jgi:hypothetical protein
MLGGSVQKNISKSHKYTRGSDERQDALARFKYSDWIESRIYEARKKFSASRCRNADVINAECLLPRICGRMPMKNPPETEVSN